jgi:hypothetical protein
MKIIITVDVVAVLKCVMHGVTALVLGLLSWVIVSAADHLSAYTAAAGGTVMVWWLARWLVASLFEAPSLGVTGPTKEIKKSNGPLEFAVVGFKAEP